jgi:hypothetical protein
LFILDMEETLGGPETRKPGLLQEWKGMLPSLPWSFYSFSLQGVWMSVYSWPEPHFHNLRSSFKEATECDLHRDQISNILLSVWGLHDNVQLVAMSHQCEE